MDGDSKVLARSTASATVCLALLVLAGCGFRRRSFDPQPDRGLLEDHWPGYYFDEVHASYSLPLFHPDPSLSRVTESPIQVVSNDPRAPKSLGGEPTVRPTHAVVEFDYAKPSAAGLKREMRVTLFWPHEDRQAIGSNASTSETKVVPVDFDTVREFLQKSGRYRVDRDDHYYSSTNESKTGTNADNPILVKLEIQGSSPASNVARSVDYNNVGFLYDLAKRVWPGID